MKFYDCKVWSTDGDTQIRVNQVVKTCLPAPEVMMLRRLHNESTAQVVEVKEVECTDKEKLERTDAEWRDHWRAWGYSRKLITAEFGRDERLPTTLDAPRRTRKPAAEEEDFGMDVAAA